MSAFRDTLDELQDYRDAYKRDFLDVPEHEIVMSPAKHCELMDDPIAMHHVDHSMGERNFQGVPILLRNVDGIEVRDRTVQQ